MAITSSHPSVLFPLVIGQERLLNEFSRVPKHDDLWMVYFNINDSKFTRMLATFCRIVAERLEKNTRDYIILAPETATISMAHVLRLQYGFDVQLIGKKQRPNAKPGALSDTYNPITGGTPQTIFFNGFDEGIDLSYPRQVASPFSLPPSHLNIVRAATHCAPQLVLIDNVVTTGETFKSVCRLMHAHAPSMIIKEAIVMWTEGEGAAFQSIPIVEGRQLPIVSVGGHIPLLTTQQLHDYAAQQQQQQRF